MKNGSTVCAQIKRTFYRSFWLAYFRKETSPRLNIGAVDKRKKKWWE